uniref:Sodium-coupled monocarboxylate transporter 1 n=1 Tax=Phallusia mammillata TaxID=59560 RepID=A0A6F9DTG2_9ASCI|nr:sodium-coupled monocarboxylate transporter 1 [Phallusia mammillata]
MWKVETYLNIWDYIVLVLLFAISSGIGLFFAIRDRKKAKTSDYLMGGRNMHAVPVAFSATTGFLSAIAIIATPAEFYRYGTMYLYYVITYFLNAIICSSIYVPLFYRLGVNSTYEYLEMRFDRRVRLLVSAIFILQQVMYCALVIYAPALALNAVTGLDLWTAILMTGVVCTFYTTTGGLRAVIWTDVFQFTVMLAGFLAIIVRGCYLVGGAKNMWKIAERGGRIDFNHFDFDPRVRHSFWTMIVGGTIHWAGRYGTTHTSVQRYLCCKTETHAKAALYLNFLGIIAIDVLAGLAGITMYAYYAECDPYTAGWVTSSDQLTPYLVMDILSKFPGLPGLFVCSALSGSLSTISSGLNAMAAVALEDFIKPYKRLSSRVTLLLSKMLVVLFGAACIATVVLAANLGEIFQAAASVNAVVLGPSLALFTMGWGFPWINSWGAMVGMTSGVMGASWCLVGKQIHPPLEQYARRLELVTVACEMGNMTAFNSTTVASLNTTTLSYDLGTNTTAFETQMRHPIAEFYAMSYTLYGVFGFIVNIVVAHVVSVFTGFQRPRDLPKGVTIAFFDLAIFRWTPERIRKVLRFGIDYEDPMRGRKKKPTLDVDRGDNNWDESNVAFKPNDEEQT